MENTAQPLSNPLTYRHLSAADYNLTHQAMLTRTLERIALKKEHAMRTADELWIVEHNDVYTLGQAGKESHILQRTDTPIIKTDRGGQVTWHGRGQLVIYWLFDLHSLGWSVRNLVSHAEQAIEDVINDCLHHSNKANVGVISAHARRDAPGVYLYTDASERGHHMDEQTHHTAIDDNIMLGKIASLGFKIKHGFSYHGIAVNLNCDLSAFDAINPCGYAGMKMLRLADFIDMSKNAEPSLNDKKVTQKLIDNIAKRHAGMIGLRALAAK